MEESCNRFPKYIFAFRVLYPKSISSWSFEKRFTPIIFSNFSSSSSNLSRHLILCHCSVGLSPYPYYISTSHYFVFLELISHAYKPTPSPMNCPRDQYMRTRHTILFFYFHFKKIISLSFRPPTNLACKLQVMISLLLETIRLLPRFFFFLFFSCIPSFCLLLLTLLIY